MDREGVHTYLLLIDPASLTVLWANDTVEERVIERSGTPSTGRHVTDVIPFAESLGIPQRLREVAETGEPRELHSIGFSVLGEGTKTTASMYRMPSGELLLASEYLVDGVLT
jgi:hypothetical protein